MSFSTEVLSPYLLFVGEADDPRIAKTAVGIRYWRPERCLGQLRFQQDAFDLDLPDMSVEEAIDQGAKTLVVGVAPPGGGLPASWVSVLEKALLSGLDIAGGLHDRLSSNPVLSAAAKQSGRQIHDVRHPQPGIPLGSGKPRSGKRLLTVGTDCAIGKMYAALAIEREMARRSIDVDFRATGQTGILIAGRGVSVDAVVADFVCGAAELVSPQNGSDHWDIIEGQGSLFHPSYAGVSLGLLHGSQPDAIVMCHDVSHHTMLGAEGFALPDLPTCIEQNLSSARLTNPAVECVGVAVNTSSLDEEAAHGCLEDLQQITGLPAVDPVRTGVKPIVDLLLGDGV